MPVSCLAEEIDTPGKGQIRALITVAGNPALTAPGAERLQKALPMLDAMISVDNWINETTKHAHVILPGLSPLEQPHFDDLLWLFAVRSAGKWSEAIFPPTDGRPGEWEVLIRLGGILMGQKASEVDVAALDDGWFDFLVTVNGLDPATVRAHYESGGPERLLDLSLRTGPWGDRYGENPDGITLQTFKDNPDGLDFGPMVSKVRSILRTPSGKLEIAPEYVTDDIPRLMARLERPADLLVMTSRRHLAFEELVDASGRHPRRRLQPVHPLHAPRGRGELRRQRRPIRPGHERSGQRRRRAGGDRRDDGRRRLAAARLGSHRCGSAGRRQPPARRDQQQPAGSGRLRRRPLRQRGRERIPGDGRPHRRAGGGLRRSGGGRRRNLNPRLLLAVAVGGAAGGAARAGIALAWPAGHHQIPWAILVINVAGSFLIGAFLQLVVLGEPRHAHWRALATTGFCGGFTTWSTFMVGADELIARHRPGLALAYLAISVVAGLFAVVAGAGITERLAGTLMRGGQT